ncbi:MAG: hypothetical protein ACXACY_30520 [Candidatus Hodarchaeales archaeon]|jgi:hypothetical protein
MDIGLQKRLLKDYPTLFKALEENTSGIMLPLSFGIECGNGWFDLINKLFKELAKDETMRLSQVKEKFGGLRVYTYLYTEESGKLIDEAEKKSFRICELCGEKGRPRNTMWIKTLCKKHADLYYGKEGY